MEESEKRKRIKRKLKKFLNNPYNLLLILIMGVVIVAYFYYFFNLGEQAIWWDEGDYLVLAKEIALGRERPEWWDHFVLMRPMFIPLIWSFIFKFGFSEMGLRFITLLVPSIITVFLTYKIGESLFNKRAGLIAAAIIGFNWVWVFYTFRLLTDIPATIFAALSFWFFWEYYEKRNKNIGLYLAVVFGVFSFLSRYTGALILLAYGIYLIVTRGFKIFKKKEVYIAAVIGLLVLTPMFLYFYGKFGDPFPAFGFYHGGEALAAERTIGWNVLTFHLPALFSTVEFVIFIVGFILILEFFLYFDLIIKGKDKKRNNLLWVFLVVVLPLWYFTFITKDADPRYFLFMLPVLAAVGGYGLERVIRFIGKNVKNKKVYVGLLLIAILGLGYMGLSESNNFINVKKGSYQEVKDAGMWLRDNTGKDKTVMGAAVVMLQYYSERMTYDFALRDENGDSVPRDKDLFYEKIENVNPDYYVLDVYHGAFTPDYAYSYPQENQDKMVPVQAFGEMNGQPMVVIYQFTN